MCHWCQLIIPDNFYFHHHGQSSIYNFSNTEFRTHGRTPENLYIEVGRAHLKIGSQSEHESVVLRFLIRL